MRRLPLLSCLLLLASAPAGAEPLVYEYQIQHPTYGVIGTYTNTVDRAGETEFVTTVVRVAVNLFGIIVYRQTADRTEIWHGDRLISFRGVTQINTRRMEVSGDARGDGFVIQSPDGISVVPPEVRPNNPWSARILRPGLMMSTTTGKVFRPLVTSRDETLWSDTRPYNLRRYEIASDKHESVWIDPDGVVLAFRTEEDGSRIDFVLTRFPDGAPATTPPGAPSDMPRVDGKLPPATLSDRRPSNAASVPTP